MPTDARTQPQATPSQAGGMAQRIIIPLIVLGAVMVAGLYLWPVTRQALERRERVDLDDLHASGRKTPAREDIVVLAIDDASLKLDSAWPEDIEASPALQAMEKQWPWPRRAWAHILDRLFEAGAKQVFLDITFKSPSEDPENDRLLREAVARYRGKLVLGMKFEDSTVGGATVTELMLPTPAIAGDVPDLENTGLLTFWPDPDGRIRTVNWRTTASEAEARASRDFVVPNPDDPVLSSISLLLARKIDPIVEVPGDSSRIRFSAVEIKDPINPIKDAYPPVSLFQIFIPGMWESNLSNGEIFRGKTILLGATATDLQDIQATPLGSIPGVQVHAHALSALLQKSFVYEAPGWVRWASIALAAVIAWLLVIGFRMPLFTVMGLFVVYLIGDRVAAHCFDGMDLEVSSQPFTLALAVCGIAGMTGRFVVQLQESRKLQRFLVRYTSPEFVNEMMADRAGLYTTLGGVERKVTVFFSDVRGFTSMSENMTPAQVVGQLNEYLSRMVACVFQNRGMVDKFIGDAVMGLWGSTRFIPTPEGYKHDALNAVSAAVSMRTALDELNAGWRTRGVGELKFGMGIHQGEVIVGNIGSEAPYEKMDLTVIGDAVNLASRLESITKQYGVDLIVSEAVYQHVKDEFLCRSADLVAVKGKVKPVEIFNVIGPKQPQETPGLADYERGVLLYREGKFAEAAEAFAKAGAGGLDDSLTQMYQERCVELMRQPPADWNGVYVMKTK